MKIPFNNLKAQYQSIQQEVDAAINECIQSFHFIRGKYTEEFENRFATKINANHCIATGNGTDSLSLILNAIGVGEGDEVITPAFSWISSSEVISACGVKPVFADVDPVYYTIDPQKVLDKITAKTKAVIAVHLYGQIADILTLKSICEKFKIHLIEDCAQAHFSKMDNQAAGTFSTAAAFSFYPTKNLGAYGDAGCVVTNKENLSLKIRQLANHGALKKDDHAMEGRNSRMDELQAAILGVKLNYIDQWNEQRWNNAQQYKSQLSHLPELILPSERSNSKHSFHLFVILARDRDNLQKYLQAKGIETLIHYPQALPNLPFYKTKENYPVAERLSKSVLSLPVHPELTNEEICFICEKIEEYYT
jgi:dTDP-4-amino-4,6-dideoxygalactose transaminase